MSQIGIVGWGAYVPRFRIKAEEIARVWGKNADDIKEGLMINEKSVPDIDEDAITISVEAGKNALARAKINPTDIGALYIGSESHPYAVKPSSTTVAEINEIMQNAANDVLHVNNEPLVSCDFNHYPASAVFDLTQTRVIGDLVKVIAWYDNEWGFSNRMLDTALFMMNI